MKVEEAPAKKNDVKAPSVEVHTSSDCNCAKALAILVDALYEDDTINDETYNAVNATLNGGTYSATEKMSKKEIDEMFSFVEK